MNPIAEHHRRRALGKGLEALLPGRPPQSNAPGSVPRQEAGSAAAAADGVAAVKGVLEIPVDRIERSPSQPRSHFDEAALQDLANSIAATGVVQPALVRPLPEGRYQIIAGERRWLASKRAGKATIPVIVHDVSEEQAMEMTIVENLQRSDLNPMEQARAFDRLGREFHMTQEKIAQRTGKDRTSVANFLRLLRLPSEVQQKVEAGELSFGHARALLALDSPESIAAAARKVLALSMSVRQTESYISGLLHPEGKAGTPEKTKEPLDPNVREARDRLQRALGLKVRIEDRKGRGKVIIEYARLEDFDALLDAIAGD